MLEFPKRVRLLRRLEFTSTMDKGLKVVTPYLVLLGQSGSQQESRMGLIVSKKVGPAVVRNKVKRRLREAFRNWQARPQGLDFVIIARASLAEAEYEQVQASFQEALRRLEKKLQPKALPS